jgi:nicotinate-nucleotide adenylyltransferase
MKRGYAMYEIAVYGGAFNPPHAGHAGVMIEASRQAKSVLVVPSFKHPLGKVMMDFDLRMTWLGQVVAAVGPKGSAPINVSDIERALWGATGCPTYSYDLLSHIAQAFQIPEKSVALVVGRDVADQLPSFYLGPQLLERFSIICVEEQVGVRSTAMRHYIQDGLPMPDHWVAPGMTPCQYAVYAKGAA